MRPMDQNDTPQNSTKPDNSNHSSPVPSPPPQPSSTANIRLNSTLRLTTIYDVTRTGKVVAYDPSSNMVTLRTYH